VRFFDFGNVTLGDGRDRGGDIGSGYREGAFGWGGGDSDEHATGQESEAKEEDCELHFCFCDVET